MWGRDHWSLLAYIEDGCVNSPIRSFRVDKRKLQTNLNRHPQHMPAGHPDGSEYGIRLSDGTELEGSAYDEWDCLDDLEREGYIMSVGTGQNPAYEMTEIGHQMASRLRQHKLTEGYSSFRPFGRASAPARD